jgi:hypothetical protein
MRKGVNETGIDINGGSIEYYIKSLISTTKIVTFILYRGRIVNHNYFTKHPKLCLVL